MTSAATSKGFARDLPATNLTPATQRTHLASLDRLARFLEANGMPTDVAAIRREHLEAFLEDQLARWKPATAANRYPTHSVRAAPRIRRLRPMNGCFTCEVNAGTRQAPGDTIYEDDYWLADHGTPPLVQGYIVLKPKRHVEDGADLRPDEAGAFGPAAQRLLHAMRAALKPERIYICSFGEGVRHVHFHLLPRYAGMPELGPSLLEPLFAERWRCTDEEAEGAAERVRAALATEESGAPVTRDAVADT